MLSLAPLERGGIPPVSAAAARTDEDAVDGGMQVNQGVGRSWIVPPRVTQRVESGVVNVGYVESSAADLRLADCYPAYITPFVASSFA